MENTKSLQKNHPVKDSKYLTFFLNGAGFGVHILKVREIIGIMPITQLPQTPEFVRGVINLRGRVIPVIDLRLRFGIEDAETGDRTCIIVMEIEAPDRRLQIGVIVDAVSDVISLKDEDIEKKVSLGVELKSDVIQGVAKLKDGIKILLNVDRILTTEESYLLNQAA
ncbi:MAG: chemotaxis protein CheW [Thermodesulfobacteriota bacterium]